MTSAEIPSHLRQYARVEGVQDILPLAIRAAQSSDVVAPHKKEIREKRKERRRKRIQILLFKAKDHTEGLIEKRQKMSAKAKKVTEKVSEKTVDYYFDGLTWYRNRFGKKGGLFRWEKEAYILFPDIDFKQDARERYLEMKREKVFPKKIFDLLAKYSTTESESNAILATSNELMNHQNTVLSSGPVEAEAVGASKATLLGMATQSDLSTAVIGGLGWLLESSAAKLDPEGQYGNHIERMGYEASLLWFRSHYLTHLPALLESPVPANTYFSYAQLPETIQRIFTAARQENEKELAERKMKATIRGIIGVHLLNILSSESGTQLATRIGEAAAAGVAGALVYLYLHNKNVNDGAEDYDLLQKESIAVIDEGVRVLEEGKGIDEKRMADIKRKRDEIVALIHGKNIDTQSSLVNSKWGIIGISSALGFLLPGEFSAASPVITAQLLSEGISPLLRNNYTWTKAEAMKRRSLDQLNNYIRAIEASPYRVPTHKEKKRVKQELVAQGFEEIQSYGDYLATGVADPVIIHKLDLGTTEKTMDVEHPIRLSPGTVSVINLREKESNALVRMLTFERGDISNIKITKGDMDFRVINERLSLVSSSYAAHPFGGATIAEQLGNFILDPQFNLFKKELYTMESRSKQGLQRVINVYGYLFSYENNTIPALAWIEPQVRRVAHILLSNDNPEKERFVHEWTKNPYLGRGSYDIDSDEALASAILSVASANYLRTVFENIGKTQEAISYLDTVPEYATDKAALWNLRKNLTGPKALAIIDRPINAHVIDDYLKEYPGAVLLLTKYENQLINDLRSRNPRRPITDKLISASKKSTETNTILEVKSLLRQHPRPPDI